VNRTLTRRLLAGVFAVELLVPAVLVATTDPPRRFAWSMFVDSRTVYGYTGTRADGSSVVLDPADAGGIWQDVHYGPQTIALLCRAHPDVVQITRTYDGTFERGQAC
jgi:hypothetical protein